MSGLDDAVHQLVVTDPAAAHDAAAAARRHALSLDPLLHGAALDGLVRRVVDRVEGLGVLQGLLDDVEVNEVMVNAGRDVWIERAGRLERASTVVDATVTAHLIERVVAPLGRRADRSSPIVDARLPDGARVHAVVPPVAVDGPCLTIRRFAARPLPLAAFAPQSIVVLLRWLVRARSNVLVSGATASGKTTLLNALAAELPAAERVITIEDAAELRLPGDHVVRLEARPPSADGAGEVTPRDLVRAALRMRPDRLVVGEVRGPEALDMVMAMSTGHDGSLSTCHANSALDALRRIEVMVLQGGGDVPLPALRELVHAAIDVVVHVARRPDGARAVAEVVELAAPGDAAAEGVRRLADGRRVVRGPTRAARATDVDRFEVTA
jgi:pilus assembly protein CpaF